MNDQIIAALSSIYLNYCDEVQIMDTPLGIPECRDASDQPFLVLAYVAHADYIVTRDTDLLALKDESKVPIVTPSELWAILDVAL